VANQPAEDGVIDADKTHLNLDFNLDLNLEIKLT
jgi:hypothetical protein